MRTHLWNTEISNDPTFLQQIIALTTMLSFLEHKELINIHDITLSDPFEMKFGTITPAQYCYLAQIHELAKQGSFREPKGLINTKI